MDIAGDVTFSVRRRLISRGATVVAVGVRRLSQITASVVLVGPDIRAIEIGVGRGIGVASDIAVGVGVGLIGRYPGRSAIRVGRLRQVPVRIVMIR